MSTALDPSKASPGEWLAVSDMQTMEDGSRRPIVSVVTTDGDVEYAIGQSHPLNGSAAVQPKVRMNGRLFAASKSMAALLLEAVGYEAAAFDEDQPVPGADLVDWFAEFRRRAAVVLGTAPAAEK